MSIPWAYLDGDYLPEADARIAITDPALLHGRGLFETIRTYGGQPFRLAAHLDRLERAAKALEIAAREEREAFSPVVRDLVRRAGLPDAYVRITVTPEHTFITARALSMYPPELYARGAALSTWPHQRYSGSPLNGLKTINYLEPDRVHVLIDGRIVKSGGMDLARALEEKGYGWLQAPTRNGAPAPAA